MNKKMKPTAVEITSWSPHRKVMYKCSNCGQDFRIFGTRELFCHRCGTEVDWQNIILQLPEPFDKNDYEGEKTLIEYINHCQLKK